MKNHFLSLWKVLLLAGLSMAMPVAQADEAGIGNDDVDPDSIHDPGKPHIPEASDPSTESTDTWWNDLLELFDLDTSNEE